jgi:tetratricopeptide (TPR) repeat protein
MSEPDALSVELDQAIESGLGQLAKSVAEESYSPEDRLQTLDAHAKRVEIEIRQDIQNYKKKCHDGMRYLLEALDELSHKDTEINLDHLREELQAGFSKLNSLQAIEKMGQEVMQGSTWKKVLGLQESTLNTLYKGAKALFEAGKYSEAEAAFMLLTSLDAAQSTFWLALGHTEFYLNSFAEAINAYEAAGSCESASCWPPLYAANCYEAANDFPKALECAEKAQALFVESGEKDPALEEAIREKIAYLKHRA